MASVDTALMGLGRSRDQKVRASIRAAVEWKIAALGVKGQTDRGQALKEAAIFVEQYTGGKRPAPDAKVQDSTDYKSAVQNTNQAKENFSAGVKDGIKEILNHPIIGGLAKYAPLFLTDMAADIFTDTVYFVHDADAEWKTIFSDTASLEEKAGAGWNLATKVIPVEEIAGKGVLRVTGAWLAKHGVKDWIVKGAKNLLERGMKSEKLVELFGKTKEAAELARRAADLLSGSHAKPSEIVPGGTISLEPTIGKRAGADFKIKGDTADSVDGWVSPDLPTGPDSELTNITSKRDLIAFLKQEFDPFEGKNDEGLKARWDTAKESIGHRGGYLFKNKEELAATVAVLENLDDSVFNYIKSFASRNKLEGAGSYGPVEFAIQIARGTALAGKGERNTFRTIVREVAHHLEYFITSKERDLLLRQYMKEKGIKIDTRKMNAKQLIAAYEANLIEQQGTHASRVGRGKGLPSYRGAGARSEIDYTDFHEWFASSIERFETVRRGQSIPEGLPKIFHRVASVVAGVRLAFSRAMARGWSSDELGKSYRAFSIQERIMDDGDNLWKLKGFDRRTGKIKDYVK